MADYTGTTADFLELSGVFYYEQQGISCLKLCSCAVGSVISVQNTNATEIGVEHHKQWEIQALSLCTCLS